MLSIEEKIAYEKIINELISIRKELEELNGKKSDENENKDK